jgi:hypothetical protein
MIEARRQGSDEHHNQRKYTYNHQNERAGFHDFFLSSIDRPSCFKGLMQLTNLKISSGFPRRTQ